VLDAGNGEGRLRGTVRYRQIYLFGENRVTIREGSRLYAQGGSQNLISLAAREIVVEEGALLCAESNVKNQREIGDYISHGDYLIRRLTINGEILTQSFDIYIGQERRSGVENLVLSSSGAIRTTGEIEIVGNNLSLGGKIHSNGEAHIRARESGILRGGLIGAGVYLHRLNSIK
jgi:hypothetical protein